MSFLLTAIADCFTSSQNPTHSITITEKELSHPNKTSQKSDQEIANEILTILFAASKNDPNLDFKVQSTMSTTGWKQSIAERVLNGLQSALEKGAPMGEAMKDAFTKSAREGYEFAKEHPVYFAVIALGVLVLLAPWALEALGFAELGPVEGEIT